MAIVSCAECSGKVSDLASACPHCGAPVAKPEPVARKVYVPEPYSVQKKGGGWWKWVFGVPVAMLVLFLGFGATQKPDPEKERAQQAYSNCIERLASMDRARTGSNSLLAATCERMRLDFEKKYRRSP